MYIMKFLLLAPLLALPLAAQNPVPERSGNLQVFRCVLDERPRMIVIRLGQEHAVAFDTEFGLLWKAWKAEPGQLPVKLEGAVYNGAHGPQPTSQGKIFFTDADPQLICSDKAAQLQYLGHLPQSDGTAIVRWAFRDKEHRNLAVIAAKPTFESGKIVINYKVEGESAPGINVSLRPPGTKDGPVVLGTESTAIEIKP